MEGVRELLESSTIHGLTYISTIKTPIFKLFWVAVVLCGFTTTAFLISNAFSDWAESPIGTSIETFPIRKAEFPRVTVCPPKGTNTALNLDLTKADNSTLNETKRVKLVNLS